MIKRAGDAGLKTLVFTVDVPEGSNRERNVRNGWGRPLKLSWATRLEALEHPAWMLEWLRHGTPYVDNWAKYAPAKDADSVADFVASQNRAPMTWKHVERYRKLWKGNFVLKGIMHPEDALRAHSLGVDGLMVSNHGARQLDNAPSPLQVLPAINAAVGDGALSSWRAPWLLTIRPSTPSEWARIASSGCMMPFSTKLPFHSSRKRSTCFQVIGARFW